MLKLSNNLCKKKICWLKTQSFLLHCIVNFMSLLLSTALCAADFHENDLQTETAMLITLPKRKEHQEFIDFTSKLDYDPYTFEGSIFAAPIFSRCLRKILPDGVEEKLKNMGVTGQPSVCIIKGLPTDPVIPRFEPESIASRSDAKKTRVSESVIHALAGIMGYCVESLPEEHNGRSIHNVTPIKGAKKTASSIGAAAMKYHTDNPYSLTPPDFFILLGLEADYGTDAAATSYLLIEPFLRTFDPKIIEEMKKPQFKIRSNASVIGTTLEEWLPLIQLQEGERVRLRLRSEEKLITAKDFSGEKVLSYIREKLSQQQPSGKVVLEAGDALIINNGWGLNKPGGVMHGRTGHINNPYRWIQRGSLFRPFSNMPNIVKNNTIRTLLSKL